MFFLKQCLTHSSDTLLVLVNYVLAFPFDEKEPQRAS